MTDSEPSGAGAPAAPSGAITLFYYEDLPAATAWYRDALGLRKIADYGWCVIFHIGGGAHLGLIDATNGSQRPTHALNKGVILSIALADVAGQREHFVRAGVLDAATALAVGCGGRMLEFKLRDPGGYTVEFFSWLDPPSSWAG